MHGRCACGSLRYAMTRAPMTVHCCHCTACQRETGSAFAVNAVIERDAIVVESGELAVTTWPTESGRPHDIHRCVSCGSVLWSDYGRRQTMVFLRVGTLDAPGQLPPDVHIFTRSKLPWVALPPDRPAYEAFYPRLEAVWTEEALARRRALGF